jgi:aspartate kinase
MAGFCFMFHLKPTVMKFGGSSVESEEAFARVAEIVCNHAESPLVVVVSAMSGFTDALVGVIGQAINGAPEAAASSLELHLARHAAVAASMSASEQQDLCSTFSESRKDLAKLLQIISEDGRSRSRLTDEVLSYGERLSSLLLAAMLRERGLVALQVDARRCIITDGEHGRAAPLLKQTIQASQAELGPLIDASFVPVLGGFIGATEAGEPTTIGRGGSDWTASLVGAALGASEIQIWTDVPGVLTADPRLVPRARTIARLSYEEAAELAYFGAKVLHPNTIQPAIEGKIPVRICNSRAPDHAGTLVCAESEATPHTVKAIAHKTGVTTLQISSTRMLGAYGFLHEIFAVFARHRTIVDVVTTSEVSVSLSLDDTSTLPAIVEELLQLGTVQVDTNRAIICVVGDGLHGTPGIASRIFSTIDDINVTLISQGASSINLTFAIEEARVADAVGRLHQTFFETESSSLQASASCSDGSV